MIIPIDETCRIYSNERAWMVQKPVSRKGGVAWVSYLHYTDLQQLINELAKRMIRASDAQTLADALVEVERVSVLLKTALSPTYRVERVE